MKKILPVGAMAVCCALSFSTKAEAQILPGGSYTKNWSKRSSEFPSSPFLVVKNQNFLLHGFENPSIEEWKRIGPVGTSILHTNLSSGEMRNIYSSGLFDAGRAYLSYFQEIVVGFQSDTRCIYLCVWRSTETRGGVGTSKPNIIKANEEAQFFLVVFSAEKGEYLKNFSINPKVGTDVSQLVKKDNFTAGPLKLSNNRVTCFDDVFVFDEAKLVRQTKIEPPNAKPDARRK